jgi:hypothetical protein
MKTYVGRERRAPPVLTSALDGDKFLALQSYRFIPGQMRHRYSFDMRLGGPHTRSGNDSGEKVPCLFRESNLGLPARIPQPASYAG